MNLPFVGNVLGWLARRYGRVETMASYRPAQVERILLVLTTGIGDAIFSTACFESIRTAFPQADIRLFCRAGWLDMFAADPRLDGLIGYAGKFRRLPSTIAALRTFLPDVAVILHGNDPDILPLAALSGARHIVRIPTEGTRFPDLLSNRGRLADTRTLPNTHYVDNRLRILETLDIPRQEISPRMFIAPRRQQQVMGQMHEQFSGRPYWVLHLHAANTYKSLPLAQGHALVEAALAKFPGVDIVLSGGPENRTELQSIVPPHAQARVWVAAGEILLADMAACLAGAAWVVAPDTGILHLAAALDRPVIGLFSPTLPVLVGPRARSAPVLTLVRPQTCIPCLQKKCPYRPANCMAQFAVADLIEEMEKLS